MREPPIEPGQRQVHGGIAIEKRKRAFLLAEGHRKSLMAWVRGRRLPKGRYETLVLITMLARLQRDWLLQSEPRPARDQDEERVVRECAFWARPWGIAFLVDLGSELDRLEQAVKASARWLPPRARARAQEGARQRFESIAAEIGAPSRSAGALGAEEAGAE